MSRQRKVSRECFFSFSPQLPTLALTLKEELSLWELLPLSDWWRERGNPNLLAQYVFIPQSLFICWEYMKTPRGFSLYPRSPVDPVGHRWRTPVLWAREAARSSQTSSGLSVSWWRTGEVGVGTGRGDTSRSSCEERKNHTRSVEHRGWRAAALASCSFSFPSLCSGAAVLSEKAGGRREEHTGMCCKRTC